MRCRIGGCAGTRNGDRIGDYVRCDLPPLPDRCRDIASDDLLVALDP
ncbi:hypothetical protein SAMN05444340_1105 [Citreimonas salinaria]|uniref:Uncharacterized protein n=1 Tax=Citreimonas salinaria TaxID=321339 RepID=A0A1H3KNC8_9RHOB|nr:hypothetical protein SAMN05444340_1105 [Citreimonas salinaria]